MKLLNKIYFSNNSGSGPLEKSNNFKSSRRTKHTPRSCRGA